MGNHIIPEPSASAAVPADRAGDASDAALVARALSGDSAAVAEIFQAHADRIHTMCVHMLGDVDEGADVTAEVFLVALQRLDQLRDPSKLRPWLFAIARHEVYRRTRRRRRERPAADPLELSAATTLEAGDAGADDADRPDPADLAALLTEAAAGLDERDRTVMELHLTGDLDGSDLADALGVSVDNAYQLTHRMKERLERSLAALVVVRTGRDACDGLDEAASRWDGRWDVLWRKRIARHTDRCERCGGLRRAVGSSVLGGVALSQVAQAAVLAAPVSARDRVLAEGPASIGTGTEAPWSSDGFPRRRRGGRAWAAVVVALVAVLVALAFASDLGDGTLGGPTTVPVEPAEAPVREPAPGARSATAPPEPVPPPTPPPVDPAPPTTRVRPPSTSSPPPPSTTVPPGDDGRPTGPTDDPPRTTSTTSTTTTAVQSGVPTPGPGGAGGASPGVVGGPGGN